MSGRKRLEEPRRVNEGPLPIATESSNHECIPPVLIGNNSNYYGAQS